MTSTATKLMRMPISLEMSQLCGPSTTFFTTGRKEKWSTSAVEASAKLGSINLHLSFDLENVSRWHLISAKQRLVGSTITAWQRIWISSQV